MAKLIRRAIPIGAIDELITPPPPTESKWNKKNESADSFYLLLVEYRSFKKKKKFNLSFHFQSQYFSCYSVNLQPFLKSAVMCNICLFNVHLKQYSMQTGKYKDTYNLLRSDYIYLILSLLERWTKFFKTRPQAPGPHLTSPVASPAARWPAVPVSPTGLIWSTT